MTRFRHILDENAIRTLGFEIDMARSPDRRTNTTIWYVRKPGEAKWSVLKALNDLNEDARKWHTRSLAKAQFLQDRQIDGHAKITDVNCDKGYVLLEEIQASHGAPKTLDAFVQQSKPLSFAACWAMLYQITNTVNELANVEGVSGHFQLLPDNILVADEKRLKTIVIDSIHVKDERSLKDSECLGHLFLFMLSGDEKVLTPSYNWENYNDDRETICKRVKLSKHQIDDVESILCSTLPGGSATPLAPRALLRRLKEVKDAYPIPSLYSYGLLTSVVVAWLPITLLAVNLLWLLAPPFINHVLDLLKLSTIWATPTPYATVAITDVPTLTNTLVLPTTAAPTQAPPTTVVPSPTTKPTDTPTFTPTATDTPTPITPSPTPSTIAPAPVVISPEPLPPSPDVPKQRKLHLLPLPGVYPSVREACNAGNEKYKLASYGESPLIAELDVNDANYKDKPEEDPRCVLVWVARWLGDIEGERGYVDKNEVCIVRDDWDHRTERFDEEVRKSFERLNLKPCDK